MEEEFQAIANAIAKGEDPHEAYARNSDHWDLQYNVATGGSDKKSIPMTPVCGAATCGLPASTGTISVPTPKMSAAQVFK